MVAVVLTSQHFLVGLKKIALQTRESDILVRIIMVPLMDIGRHRYHRRPMRWCLFEELLRERRSVGRSPASKILGRPLVQKKQVAVFAL